MEGRRGIVDPSSVPKETIQLLNPDGTLVPDTGYEADLKKDDLLEIYRYMALARRADLEGTNLQRQGELGVYTPLIGQEAAQVGTGYALDEGDWIFPSYREMALAMMRKIDPVDILHLFRGTWHGGMWDVREHRFAMYSVPIATQALHAAGFAIAAKLDGAKTVALGCFGDGATSEGDFHEAMNFAGVWQAPVVFLCQNNQYAISVPLSKQTAAPTIAVKALGYGFPGRARRRQRCARVLRGRPGSGATRARGQRPDLDRGGHVPPRPPFDGRRSDAVPHGRRAQEVGGARPDRAVHQVPRARGHHHRRVQAEGRR